MNIVLKYKKALIGGAALVFLFVGYFLYQGKENEPETGMDDMVFPMAAPQAEKEKTVEYKKEEPPAVIKVDVKGAVHKPGVYAADPGDRVIDLIMEAGSFSDKADKDKVNLAQAVADQMVIYVPEAGDDLPQLTAAAGSTAEITGDSGTGKSKVNLNTAEQADLETLPGIGPAKAAEIIAYRNQTGFKTIEDLRNISGIGDKTFEKLKDFIMVQ
ncbi:hypothetical protein D0469_00705 [Peribacillus saganii]|uniref:Helix-hairpin-helix DNA-binding motif class 1 domain-containing protein n=1 Tax=Peribacillus saganii TaxID=2303992 RepID=A0A372LV33_9BACI|nr:helix-hairpin-helix domain-containing protein [Peribacillus saganii]RFU71660.1 hypothetical protein D0469_00705 [Peribacillus saganii]